MIPPEEVNCNKDDEIDRGDLNLQDWTITDDHKQGVENAGLEMTDEVARVEIDGLHFPVLQIQLTH